MLVSSCDDKASCHLPRERARSAAIAVSSAELGLAVTGVATGDRLLLLGVRVGVLSYVSASSDSVFSLSLLLVLSSGHASWKLGNAFGCLVSHAAYFVEVGSFDDAAA